MDQILSVRAKISEQVTNMRKLEESGDSEIQKFFAGKTVLVTGGTGFLGKQLIEKLLRSCRGISRIYLLMRPKKDKDVKQRLQHQLQDPCYDILRKYIPNFGAKLIGVEGDMSELGLALSEANRKLLLNEVNVIFHVAATVRFDDPIKKAVLTNVRGTREVLLLAAECKNLMALVHVSTAYSHAPRSECKEEFYPSPVPPDLMIEMAETVDEDVLQRITPGLIGDWPNTYTFSKALAEDQLKRLAVEYMVPAAVIRPAVVVASYREPTAGWIDPSNVYGASGLILGIGLGALHSITTDPKCNLDFVPVDMVNNLAIAVACHVGENKIQAPTIYNYSSSRKNPLKWGQIGHILRTTGRKLASPMAFWYNFCLLTPNKYLYYITIFLWQTMPAYLLDGGAMLLGKKQRFKKIYSKIHKLMDVLSFFAMGEWLHYDENTCRLYNELSAFDKELFNFDIVTYKWSEYIPIFCLGIREYIVKDELKNTDLAIKKQYWFRIGHYIIVSLYAFIFWNLLSLLYYMFKTVVFGLCKVL